MPALIAVAVLIDQNFEVGVAHARYLNAHLAMIAIGAMSMNNAIDLLGAIQVGEQFTGLTGVLRGPFEWLGGIELDATRMQVDTTVVGQEGGT